ncbi:MAG: PLP-dependent transferase [Saprospiraceae bacterium]|nr:PLP-dependent transferase [Saprospiraceae bacterium]
MINRRTLLRNLSALPLVGGFIGSNYLLGKDGVADRTLGDKSYRDYYKELGVRTFINAAGTYTAMSGCLMRDDVLDAINYASKQYVNIDDLQDKVGERIAELLECEAATVTAGCFSALSLGLAGVLTGTDAKKAAMLPTDLTGMKSEVILQKSHHIGYAHALVNCGVKLILVETAAELEAAINDQTAMLWFLNYGNPDGQIKHDEFIRLGKKHGIPTMIDCAADVPPKENLFKYTKMGFDLVCFSGGKGLRGPQSAGLLLGRKDLIAGARQNAAPRGDTVGRGMKVNKEETLGMLAALENFLSRDHDADWKLWKAQIQHIHDAAASVDGVKPEIHVPEIANHVPSLKISWDMNKIKMDGNEVREKLRMGHPSIQTVGDKESLGITTWMLNPGEERAVAPRMKEILSGMA